jgi:hypothetical protein
MERAMRRLERAMRGGIKGGTTHTLHRRAVERERVTPGYH